MEELELTSLTACSMASLATLPMDESKVKIAPMLTMEGVENETFEIVEFE